VTGCCSPRTTHRSRLCRREFFGLARLVDLLTRQEAAGQAPAETLRRLIHTVLHHRHVALQG